MVKLLTSFHTVAFVICILKLIKLCLLGIVSMMWKELLLLLFVFCFNCLESIDAFQGHHKVHVLAMELLDAIRGHIELMSWPTVEAWL